MTGIPMVDARLATEGGKRVIGILKWAVPLLALLAIAIYIAVLKGDIRHLTKDRDQLLGWKNNMVAVVAAETPVERRNTVTGSTAPDEVRWLGREYRTHKQALDEQSAKLRAAADKATAAQNDAAEARKRAKDAQQGRDTLRRALNAPGRSTGLTEGEWGKL